MPRRPRRRVPRKSAIWLVPNDPQLTRSIAELCQAQNCPPFVPHLTILAGFTLYASLDFKAPLRTLASRHQRLRLSTGAVNTSEEFLRSLFVECKSTKELEKLQSDAKEVFGGRLPAPPHHVSLLYSNLSVEQRTALAAVIKVDGPLVFDSISLVSSGAKGWRDVGRWREQYRVRLP